MQEIESLLSTNASANKFTTLFIYFAAGVYPPAAVEGHRLVFPQKDRNRGPAFRQPPSRKNSSRKPDPPPVLPKPKGFKPPPSQGADGGREEQLPGSSHHCPRQPNRYFPRAQVAPIGNGVTADPRSHEVRKCRQEIEKHLTLLEKTPVQVGTPKPCLWFSQSQSYHVEVCVSTINPTGSNRGMRKFACKETDANHGFTVLELNMQACSQGCVCVLHKQSVLCMKYK